MGRPRWRQSVVAAVTAAWLYPVLAAASVEVRIEPRNTTASPTGVLRIDGAEGVSRMLPVDGRSVIVAEEPGASVEVAFHADGWWSPRTNITVPNETGKIVTLPVWQTGRVRGRLTVETGALPKELRLVVESPPEPDRVPEMERGTEFLCPVNDDGTWECDLPATILDIAFRAAGFTPHYRWGTKISHERKMDFPC